MTGEPAPGSDDADGSAAMVDSETAGSAGGRSLLGFGKRVLVDAVVIGLWVIFLTLLFLTVLWPRWAYYTLLVLGVLAYTGYTGLSRRTDRERRR